MHWAPMGLSSLWPLCILEVRIGNLPLLLLCVCVSRGDELQCCWNEADWALCKKFGNEMFFWKWVQATKCSYPLSVFGMSILGRGSVWLCILCECQQGRVCQDIAQLSFSEGGRAREWKKVLFFKSPLPHQVYGCHRKWGQSLRFVCLCLYCIGHACVCCNLTHIVWWNGLFVLLYLYWPALLFTQTLLELGPTSVLDWACTQILTSD